MGSDDLYYPLQIAVMLPRPAPAVKELWDRRLDDSEQVQYYHNQDNYHHYGDEASAPHVRPPHARFKLDSTSEKARKKQDCDYHQDDHYQDVD